MDQNGSSTFSNCLSQLDLVSEKPGARSRGLSLAISATRIQEIEGARHSCRFTIKIHGVVRNSETLGFPG
jgi:hypothetical protein